MLKICISDETVKRFIKECMNHDDCVLDTFEMEEKNVFDSKSCLGEKNIIFFTISEAEFDEFKNILFEYGVKYGVEDLSVLNFIERLEDYQALYTENRGRRLQQYKSALQ